MSILIKALTISYIHLIKKKPETSIILNVKKKPNSKNFTPTEKDQDGSKIRLTQLND